MKAVDWEHPPGLPGRRGTVATVGTFDGVHRGHWTVVSEICRRARSTGRHSVLVTFDPHPLRIVRPEHAPPALTTPVEKKEILAESGLDYAVFLSFTEALSHYQPRRFVEEVLVGRLRVEELVIGYDHGFGRDRSGDPETLRKIGEELGFVVDVVPPVSFGTEAVSSSRIRRMLSEGRVSEVIGPLGRPYSLRGTVVHGEGRGTKLGFPTANLAVDDPEKLVPLEGVYAVRAVLKSGSYIGALHVGPRPTFEDSPPSVEVHLLDFDRKIYGEVVRIDFFERLRGVQSFSGVDALLDQILRDVEQARQVVSGTGR